MATSAIGPGFLNNTSVFTQQLLTSFGFVILISILIDIGAQLNIWRIITVSEERAQDLSNKLLPGLGHVLAILVAFGGLAFNVGNIAGCGLGLEVLTGLDAKWGAIISCAIALFIFWTKEAGKAIDVFVKILGVAMIALTVYVMFASHPPFAKAIQHTFWPEIIDVKMIVALVGGTVGGYISFAGAHRLLDANIKGVAAIPQVNRSAITGIIVTAIMRYVLFLAALGVVWGGSALTEKNPAASVFGIAAGNAGYKFFGVVLWSAAITSVIGASYTSVSFWKTFSPSLEKNQRWLISGFIVFFYGCICFAETTTHLHSCCSRCIERIDTAGSAGHHADRGNKEKIILLLPASALDANNRLDSSSHYDLDEFSYHSTKL